MNKTNIRLYDMNIDKDVKQLFEFLRDKESELFSCFGCTNCDQNKHQYKWCFPIDDDDYINCEFVRKFFKEIYYVDITDIRFVEVSCNNKNEYTIDLYKKVI